MRSPSGNLIGGQLRLALAAGLLVITSLLPARALKWASWVADPVQSIIAPWEHALGWAAAWARNRAEPSRLSAEDQAAMDEIRRERDAAEFALVQARAQIDELRKRIAEVARGMELNNLPVIPVAAPVIGGAADLSTRALTIKAGRNRGVEVNNVAVVGGVQIVGKVTRVRERDCIVLPITDRAAGVIEGRVMINDTTPGPMCQLQPDGKGALEGKVADSPQSLDANGRVLPINPGTLVRLYDTSWALSGRGLIIGKVVASEPLADSPQRSFITVVPVEPIERVSEVTIRTSAPEPDTAEKGEGGKGGGTP